jgi:hypothetical protein
VNINGIVYGKVYFPVRSNRLKDLGAAVGASWPTPNPSGIESIAWRFRWEDSGQADFKAKLLAYNQADCNGLRLLTAELQSLSKAADTRVDVDFTNKPKQMTTATGEIVHRAFDGIINSAHDEYQQKRIRVIKAKGNITTTKDGRNRPRSYRRRKRVAKSAKPIIMHPKRKCPHHPKEKLKLAHMKRRVLIDLVFTRNGCRKKLVKYEGRRAFCALCKRFYSPPSFKKLTHGLFGHAFRAWTVYQRIAMRLPYAAIAQSCEVLFSEPMNTGTLEPFLHQFAKHYAPTERLLLARILESPFIHVDETKLSIRGIDHYAWGLTDGKRVAFHLTATRESNFLQEMLVDYEGVLVSDFYGGYDSMPCRQQKCLVHLIRDLNDDLWKHPFVTEYVSIHGLIPVVFCRRDRVFQVAFPLELSRVGIPWRSS